MKEKDLTEELCGYKRSSRDAYLNRMLSKEIIEIRGSHIFVSPDLFDAEVDSYG